MTDTRVDLEPIVPDVRSLEAALARAHAGRPRGRASWALRMIMAGRAVRKVIWPAGPHVVLANDGEHLRPVGVDSAPESVDVAWIFPDDETRDDVWEFHPPAPAIPTMHAPILWVLYCFPGMGGPAVFARLLDALSQPHAFAELLLAMWTEAGDPATGRAIVAALATIDRPLFHKSLYGDVETSLRILSALVSARQGAAPPAVETP